MMYLEQYLLAKIVSLLELKWLKFAYDDYISRALCKTIVITLFYMTIYNSFAPTPQFTL